MLQWIVDVAIDTKQSCDKQPGSFIQDPGKPGCFTQDPGGGKTWIFQLKTEFSQTSQDKICITMLSYNNNIVILHFVECNINFIAQ